MMKYIFTILLCFSVIAGIQHLSSYAQEERKMDYVCRDMTGERRWQADTEIVNKEGDVFVMVEKGEGEYSGFESDKVSWVSKMEFESTDDAVRPLKLEKRVFDDKGKMIRLEEQHFDLDKNIATCTHKDIPKNISLTKKFKFTKDIVNRLLLGLYVQKLLENGKTYASVQMVSEEPGFYNVEVNVLNEEEIDVNGWKKHAYRLSISPNLGVLNFAKAFFPKSYAWHSASPKFEWLRYKGLEGGIKSPEVEVTMQE